jgi:lysophospholipase L1-like esterase
LKRFGGRLLLASLATLLVLVVIELGLRFVDYAPEPPEDTLRTFTEHDPDLGWKGRSGATGLYRTRRFEVPVALNRAGWRDDEPEEDLIWQGGPGGISSSVRPHLALLGDSFAWGYGVSRGELFADRIERLLPPWRVRNYGVCGYGTDQELLLLGREVLEARPAIVIVQFSVENDLYNILGAEAYRLPKPRFVLDGGALRLEGGPVPRLPDWESSSRVEALKRSLTTHLRVYAWARPRWAVLRDRLSRLLARAGADVVATRRVRLLARDPGEKVERGWVLAEALLARAREEAAAGGARLVILPVPDRLQVETALWDEAVRVFALDADAFDRELPEKRIAEIGTRLGVTVVPLLAPFRTRAGKGEQLYIADDVHWNARGHEVAAEELARVLGPILPKPTDKGSR